MIANYHTHTPRCNHAEGSELEYVEAAIEGGLQILGFSDHTPQFFPGEHYSRMRMRPWQFDGYVDSVMGLKARFADKLQIHLGLEVEYYPAIFKDLLTFLKDYPMEYLILGQHWNGNEEGELYNGRPTEDKTRLERYCDQIIDGIYTGLFTYVAHPDILHFIGDPAIYDMHMRRICQAAKNCDLPLEINLLGLREGRQYPNRQFFRLAAEENCSVILGSDAHLPSHVIHPETEAAALDMVQALGLELLSTVPLRSL